ncbi:MAG: bifunctional oligoribonuclease/PAP phosphatase NrnA [Candidatus Neomarinimicrobiota bacterium]|jgi:phosphoesterase RecJ-like protein|nr:bifunctional oligoribonuclease/PAP phosphatase NrnA [Candidatus Neomarinimicrobiota bacterium]MDD3966431.1 bifunctional oligoribonuclease/PAP phosphatase NrnA [Candidatus Neomarinimicrobiota bacterium]MDX9779803.1 bifunctional oligoribonuclease/PAP phosphatase NrnA [bacterium]
MYSDQQHRQQWKELEQRIGFASVFVLTTHQNPDADGIGSEIALYTLLRKLGKEVHILNISETPGNLAFIDPNNLCQRYVPSEHQYLLERADLLIVLDAGSFARLGKLGEDALSVRATIVSIDHHPGPKNPDYIQEIVHENECSVGRMLYEFIRCCFSSQMDPVIARALYTAIAGDTGNFRFGNTTHHSHRVAAELLQYGIDAYQVYCNLFGNISRPGIRLLTAVLQTIQYSEDGKIVWFVITRSMLQENGASDNDTEGLTDFLRMIEGVEVSIMFKERIDGSTRINFRSRGKVTTNGVARRFGGGGHKHASGIVSELSMSELLPLVVEAMIKEVNAGDDGNPPC